MSLLTIQNHRPPNDPADFVANRVEFSGVTEIKYDTEKDQMQVGAKLSDTEALAESVHIAKAVKHSNTNLSKGQIHGRTSQTSATSSSRS